MGQELWTSFCAFNMNGINSLAYILMSNWWFLLIVLGAISTATLYLKEEIDVTVVEEQNIL